MSHASASTSASIFDSFIKMPAHFNVGKKQMEMEMEIRELEKILKTYLRRERGRVGEGRRGSGGGEGLPLHLRNLHEVAIKAAAITRITRLARLDGPIRPNSSSPN